MREGRVKRPKYPTEPYLLTLSIRRALPPAPRTRDGGTPLRARPPPLRPHRRPSTTPRPRRGMTGGGRGTSSPRARRSSKPPERGPCPARSRWRGGGPATGAADHRIREREVGGPPAEPAPPWPPRGRARAVPRCRPGFADTSSAAWWKGLSRRHGLRRRHSRAPPGTRGTAAA